MNLKTQSIGRLVYGAGTFYLIGLLAVVAYAAVTFRSFYQVMPPTLESQLNDGYRQFLGSSGLVLALFLGIGSAAFGIWKASYWQGLIVLAIGTITTLLALSVLPWVQFPFDQYAASAGWLMGNFIPVIMSWLLVTFFGRLVIQKISPLT